jgi:virginiamycin B lyase
MSVRIRLIALSLTGLCLLAGVFGASTASATSPGEITSYPTRPCAINNIAPALARGVLVRFCPKNEYTPGTTLANLLPSGEVIRYKVPRSPGGPVAAGLTGEIWVADGVEVSRETASVDRLAPDRSVQIFPIGAAKEEGHNLEFTDLVLGREGTAWATLTERIDEGFSHGSFGGELVHVDPDGIVTIFPLPSEIEPEGLVLGPEGNLWFTGIAGRYSGEHSHSAGVGYIGRMTPVGEFTLFPTPVRHSEPQAIAVGPEGRIWFTESGTDQVGTIAPDGTFGPEYTLRFRTFGGLITFGPEGDAWLSGSEIGLIRMTPAGQQTLYPGSADAVTTGPEGDIWWLEWKKVRRVVPGGPGIDIWNTSADRRSKSVSIRLACGGSMSRCKGMLNLALEIPKESPFLPKGVKELPPFRFVHTTYTVAAESRRMLVLKIPAKTFALAKRYQPGHQPNRWGLGVIATATVAGGPSLKRRIRVPVML